LLSGLVGGGEADVAQEFCHLDEIASRLPVFPADFAEGEAGGVIEGKEEEPPPVLLEEPALRVESPLLPLLFDGSSLGRCNLDNPLLFKWVVGRNRGLLLTIFKDRLLIIRQTSLGSL
jgi:hypothetical protein